MIVTPHELSNAEISDKAVYRCPTCNAQSTISKVEIGWVSCPMIGNNYICVGCCIDLQSIAHSESFDQRSDFKDFRNAADLARETTKTLRDICLKHQIKVCEEILSTNRPRIIDDSEIIRNIQRLELMRDNE